MVTKRPREVSVRVLDRDSEIGRLCRCQAAGYCKTRLRQQHHRWIVVSQELNATKSMVGPSGISSGIALRFPRFRVRCRRPLPGVDRFGRSAFGRRCSRRFGGIIYARCRLLVVSAGGFSPWATYVMIFTKEKPRLGISGSIFCFSSQSCSARATCSGLNFGQCWSTYS